MKLKARSDAPNPALPYLAHVFRPEAIELLLVFIFEVLMTAVKIKKGLEGVGRIVIV